VFGLRPTPATVSPQLEVGFGGSALLDGPRRAPAADAAAPAAVVDLG